MRHAGALEHHQSTGSINSGFPARWTEEQGELSRAGHARRSRRPTRALVLMAHIPGCFATGAPCSRRCGTTDQLRMTVADAGLAACWASCSDFRCRAPHRVGTLTATADMDCARKLLSQGSRCFRDSGAGERLPVVSRSGSIVQPWPELSYLCPCAITGAFSLFGMVHARYGVTAGTVARSMGARETPRLLVTRTRRLILRRRGIRQERACRCGLARVGGRGGGRIVQASCLDHATV